jgi:hypothetical protein
MAELLGARDLIPSEIKKRCDAEHATEADLSKFVHLLM